MNEYYFLYKTKKENFNHKYVTIEAPNILEACQEFVSDFPDAIVSVIYDKNIFPYLKSVLKVEDM